MKKLFNSSEIQETFDLYKDNLNRKRYKLDEINEDIKNLEYILKESCCHESMVYILPISHSEPGYVLKWDNKDKSIKINSGHANNVFKRLRESPMDERIHIHQHLPRLLAMCANYTNAEESDENIRIN